MASNYTPTTVQSGFGAETAINKNFDDIKEALDECLNRVQTLTTNAMLQNFDMGGYKILNLPSPLSSTEPVRLGDINTLVVPEVFQTPAFATTMNVDITGTTVVDFTASSNFTLNLTGSAVDGQAVLLRIRQDATGSRVATFGSMFRWSSDLPLNTLSTAANALDYILVRYNETDVKFDVLAMNRGF